VFSAELVEGDACFGISVTRQWRFSKILLLRVDSSNGNRSRKTRIMRRRRRHRPNRIPIDPAPESINYGLATTTVELDGLEEMKNYKKHNISTKKKYI